MHEIIKKYNVAGPRYTSYPTVPYWQDNDFSLQTWKDNALKTFLETKNDGISVYIHLPFCESLCTYCGCNTRITVNHAVEEPYIKAVLKEWEMYLSIFPEKPKIKEIHLGGGTPTFFSSGNLEKLITGILSKSDLVENFEFGFEGHPNNTTPGQLQCLYDLGFSRVSFGIQDFDSKVQHIINRIQKYETVENISAIAEKIGYESINYDLIYGLPLQTIDTVDATIEKVINLKPDRIAFYSYAHIPWLKRGQRKFSEYDLPSGEEKLKLYETGRELFEKAGYCEIGMDHFALKTDSLYKSAVNKTLHRNFMGYTTSKTKLLIGLGVSSISDSWGAFAQNSKVVEDYIKQISEDLLPVYRGHILNSEDLILRKHILNLMCSFETSWDEEDEKHPALFEGINRLDEMLDDELISIESNKIRVTEKGKPFIRNVCMALDARLFRNLPATSIFSSVV